MNRALLRAGYGAIAFACTMSAAAADRLVIDSEQGAASAALTVHSLLLDSSQELTVSRYVVYLSVPPREIAFGALQMLATQTTPAAVASLRHGLTLPCKHGGTLTARMARNQPLLLRLQWTDCVVPMFESEDTPDARHTLNGPATLELTQDSFVPSTLRLLRFGNAETSVTAYTLGADTPEFTSYGTRSLNLRMAGEIPMKRLPDGPFFGDFDFRFNGYWQDDSTSISPNLPGTPPSVFNNVGRYSAEGVAVSGSTKYDFTRATSDEDLFVERGTITVTGSSNFQPVPVTLSLSPRQLHIHSHFDYNSLGRSTTVNGRLDVDWDAYYGPGCLSGTYVVRTNEVLEAWPFFGEIYNSGSVTINNVLTTHYSSTRTESPSTFPPAPSGSVRLDVRRVGEFAHNYEWRIPLGLKALAQCSASGFTP